VVTGYTCRYSSGHLFPIIQLCQDKLGIKWPLEYLQVWVITLVSLLVVTMIPIDCKITNFFPYTSLNRKQRQIIALQILHLLLRACNFFLNTFQAHAIICIHALE